MILQKSSAEQKRAKSQASAGGCAPSPWRIGSPRRNASAEKVVCTCRSPKRICLSWLTAGAGKSRREVLASLNLTEEQRSKIESVGNEVRGIVHEEIDKIRDVLDPQQREKLSAMRQDRLEQFRARTFFAIASLRDLNLTDEQVTKLKAVQNEYGSRIEEAGNQLRAIVREEIRAIVAVVKS